MREFLLCMTWVLVLLPGTSWAYRDYFTTEQKVQLAKIQTVLIDAIAITDKGAVDAGAIAQTVSRRLGELGYTMVQDRAKPHDAVFKVKCEQRKTWEGTTAAGGDADLPDAPSRLWKGPAFQLTEISIAAKFALVTQTRVSAHREYKTCFSRTSSKSTISQCHHDRACELP